MLFYSFDVFTIVHENSVEKKKKKVGVTKLFTRLVSLNVCEWS